MDGSTERPGRPGASTLAPLVAVTALVLLLVASACGGGNGSGTQVTVYAPPT